jgi:hypothetical protein
MSLSQKIAAALDENTRAYTPPCTVAVEDGPNRLNLHIKALDSVGVALDRLEYSRTDRSDWTPASLQAWGEKLAGRLTYLLEPLKVLEIDSDEGEVQLRSQSPSVRSEQRGFYEIRLNRQGALRMERFLFDDSTRARSHATCQFTREVLERLADDVAASTA